MSSKDHNLKSNLSSMFEDSMQQSLSALQDHHYEEGKETSKLFGIFEMDSAVVSALDGFYTAFIGLGAAKLSPHTHKFFQEHLEKTKLSEVSRNRTAAGATLAVNVGLFALPFMSQFVEELHQHHKERKELLRHIRPVLDHVKGNHSLAAFFSVREDENEMLYVQRQRLQKLHGTSILNRSLGIGIKILPNVFMAEQETLRALHSGVNREVLVDKRIHQGVMDEFEDDILHFHNSKINAHNAGLAEGASPLRELTARDLRGDKGMQYYKEAATESHYARDMQRHEKNLRENQGRSEHEHHPMSAKNMVVFAINGALPTLVDKWIQGNERRLHKTMPHFSALDMVLKLDAQLHNGPDASAFTDPAGEAYPLEEYVMRIMIQHQKDMVEINHNHTEIREGLKEDVIAVAAPIAEALRKGDLSALSLVQMIGDKKSGMSIIQNNGRKIADVDTVRGYIEKLSGKIQSQMHVDPKEYYADASFTKEELKHVLAGMHGEEKTMFAMIFPDSILQEAGMSEHEIKAMRDDTSKLYVKHLAEEISGLAAKSDEELRQDGLSGGEIARLKEAAVAVAKDREAAIKELKTSPTNLHGIEQTLANVAVAKVKGDKHYVGKLHSQGKAALAAKEAEIASQPESVEPAGYASKIGKSQGVSMDTHNDNEQADNDNDERSHAARAQASRSGTDGHEIGA